MPRLSEVGNLIQVTVDLDAMDRVFISHEDATDATQVSRILLFVLC